MVAYTCIIMYNISMDKKDTQINIRVSSELLESLRKIAEAEVTTTSQLVRKSITLLVRSYNEGDPGV